MSRGVVMWCWRLLVCVFLCTNWVVLYFVLFGFLRFCWCETRYASLTILSFWNTQQLDWHIRYRYITVLHMLYRYFNRTSNVMCIFKRTICVTQRQLYDMFRRLVEKSEKIEATILALRNQGMDENSPAVQELNEMMTDQEKQQLAKLKTVQSK